MRSIFSKSSSSGGEEASEDMTNLSVQDFKPGDTAWIRANGCSYWPVQVVDENSVSCKPKKQRDNEILVRLYGTYEHLYVEPVDCFLKIENMFDQVNRSNIEILEKALEEDIARMKSGGHPKRRVYESKETQNNEASKGKKQKRGKSNTDYSTLVDSSHNPKADKPDNMGVKYKSIDGMKASVEEKRDEMMNSVLKRKTRSETFKERSSAKNVLEVLKDPQNETNGTYMKFSNEEDSENWRNEDAKKETATPHKYNKPKVKGMKQGCFLNTNANTEVELEVLNIKEIKQLVTKIVKEVAAEKARNQVLKGTAAEDISGYAWDNSKKEISLDENHLKQCSSGEVKELSSVKERGSDNEKTDGADENNEGSVNEKNERADDNSTKQSLSNVADQTNCRTRRANTVNHRPLTRAKSLTSMKMVEDGNSQANESKAEVKTRLRDERREQMESLVPAPVTIIDENSQSNAAKEELKTSLRDERREQMESPVTTKCPIPEEYGDLSLRRMKVMQSLGLIAPSGSPFSKNGSIKSLASSANLS